MGSIGQQFTLNLSLPHSMSFFIFNKLIKLLSMQIDLYVNRTTAANVYKTIQHTSLDNKLSRKWSVFDNLKQGLNYPL